MHISTDHSEVNNGVIANQFLAKDFRLLDRYELQESLVECLEKTRHHRHLAARVARCHHSFRHWRCENNHDWAEAENSCSVRVCPHCSRRRSLVLAGRIEAYVVGKEGLRYAVLAERNTKNLKQGMTSLWAAWTRLRRSVRWKRKVKGCIVAMEVTRNPVDGSWHPHLNVLMEGEYFPFEELNQAWVEATDGEGHTSFIRAADAGTVRELIKYVTKIADLLEEPAALDEFLSAVHQRRLVRTYGTFFGIPVEDEENPRGQCPDGCGKDVNVVKLGYVAANQLSFDFEKGVFRVLRSPSVIASELRDAEQFYPSLSPPPRFKPVSAIERRLELLHKNFAATSRLQGATKNVYGSSGTYATPA